MVIQSGDITAFVFIHLLKKMEEISTFCTCEKYSKPIDKTHFIKDNIII